MILFGHDMTLVYDDREFDEGLLQKMPEISYEDDINDVPSPPDVSNYLVSEVSHGNFLVFGYLWCWKLCGSSPLHDAITRC